MYCRNPVQISRSYVVVLRTVPLFCKCRVWHLGECWVMWFSFTWITTWIIKCSQMWNTYMHEEIAISSQGYHHCHVTDSCGCTWDRVYDAQVVRANWRDGQWWPRWWPWSGKKWFASVMHTLMLIVMWNNRRKSGVRFPITCKRQFLYVLHATSLGFRVLLHFDAISSFAKLYFIVLTYWITCI